MRALAVGRTWLTAGVAALALTSLTRSAGAQMPPPPYYPPPPVYGPIYAPPPPPVQPPQAPYVIDDWDPDAATPPGYNRTTHSNGRLLGAGIALFSVGWLTSALVASIGTGNADSSSERPASAWRPLYVPIAGPFFALGSMHASPVGTGALVLSGVVQVAGALGIALGIADERVKLVKFDPNAPNPAPGVASRSSVRPPLVLSGTILAGLGAGAIAASGITWLVAATASTKLDKDCPNHICYRNSPGGDDYVTTRDAANATNVLLGVGMPTLGAGVSLLMLSAGFGGSRVIASPMIDAHTKGGLVQVAF